MGKEPFIMRGYAWRDMTLGDNTAVMTSESLEIIKTGLGYCGRDAGRKKKKKQS